MCCKIIPTYGRCGGHNGNDNPELVMWDTDACSKKLKENCPNKREQHEDHPDQECWRCASFYKHCYGSTICPHEWDHMITDCDRLPHEEDIILVTPMFEVCPECKAAGYDRGPPSAIPKTKSMMPAEFEGKTRITLAPSVGGASVFPGGFAIPTASLKPGVSKVPSSTYNRSQVPSFSRQPPACRIPSSSRCPTEAPAYSTKTPTQLPLHPVSNYPESYHVPSSKAPSTQVYNPVSKAPQTSTKALSVAELLARGPPKNVAASAFYDNPDGAEARARVIGGGSVAPGLSQMPSSRTAVVPSHYPAYSTLESRTQAPPADAPSLDLDAIMGDITISPTAEPSASRVPTSASHVPTSKVPSSSRPAGTGNTQYPSMAPSFAPSLADSRTPAGHSKHPNHLPQAQPSAVPSSSRVPAASTIPSASRAPATSAVPSSSRVLSSSQAPPAGKSHAPPRSKSNAPTTTTKAKRVGQMSAVPEADEDLYRF